MEQRTAPALRVPKSRGEELRRLLSRRGLLDPELEIRREEEFLLLPLKRGLWLPPRGTRRATSRFEVRRRTPEPPVPFEIVGDLAILKVHESRPRTPEEERAAAEAILRSRPHLKTVLRPESGVEGLHRVRSYRALAGEERTATLYRENGFTFHVDLARAYFSPRLAGERARLAGLVGPEELVVDLMAGGGYLAVQLGRRARRVVACDANPAAVELLRRNLAANRIGNVEVREGDARAAVGAEGADRAVLDFPTDPAPFLAAARRVLRPGGILHVYGVVPEGRPAALADLLRSRLPGDAVGEVRRLRPYAPRRWLAVGEVVIRPS